MKDVFDYSRNKAFKLQDKLINTLENMQDLRRENMEILADLEQSKANYKDEYNLRYDREIRILELSKENNNINERNNRAEEIMRKLSEDLIKHSRIYGASIPPETCLTFNYHLEAAIKALKGE